MQRHIRAKRTMVKIALLVLHLGSQFVFARCLTVCDRSINFEIREYGF